jgi:hypothetical protein
VAEFLADIFPFTLAVDEAEALQKGILSAMD